VQRLGEATWLEWAKGLIDLTRPSLAYISF